MNFRKILPTIAIFSSVIALSACIEENNTQKQTRNIQAEKAAAAANSITFTDNAEIENIQARLKLTSNPGLLGYIVLLNETGQAVMHEAVKGKITSGSKRLNETDRLAYVGNGNNGYAMTTRSAPSDEGTYGSSDSYIFYFTQNGEYRQWNGKYLYSDQPFRLSVQPLIVSATIK